MTYPGSITEDLESVVAGRRRSGVGFHSVAALLFAAAATVTIVWSASMRAMGGMPMPGGWTLSMTWMRMPGQTWLGAAASFLGMWVVMMVAMMLPSLAPRLWHYRRANGRSDARVRLTVLAAAGYFLVWTVIGMAAFPAGAAVAAIEMRTPMLARAAPVAAALVVLIAGVLQLTAWKARHLVSCRVEPRYDPAEPRQGSGLSADADAAWRYGLRLGLRCSACCAGLTAILLVIGVMDVRAMALVTAAMTVERLAPAGVRVAQAIGVVCVGAGLRLMLHATGIA